MKESLLMESPAKVNLRLEIVKKRKDGYHELRTVFQKIDLHDTLRFELTKKKGVSITTDHPDLPVGKENLVSKAARLMFERIDFREGIHVEIEKRIPLGAGLGGGSSNAAATLKALNQMLGAGFSKKELKEIGVKIGADVPFFLTQGAAVGSGIGERLKKIELPVLWYILIYPNFEVSARWAYQHFILTKRQFHINLHKFPRTPRGISRVLLNDLEGVVSKEYPQIETMKKILCSAGALGALMSGSGPTVFGIFSGQEDASEAYNKVKTMVRGKGWMVLNSHAILD
jgi:4-diphosphocytidyl-2-C-methyl-D-erythritol kinase